MATFIICVLLQDISERSFMVMARNNNSNISHVGSAFFISPEFGVTCLHVVAGSTRIILENDDIAVSVKIAKILPKADLVLLSLNTSHSNVEEYIISPEARGPDPDTLLLSVGWGPGSGLWRSSGTKFSDNRAIKLKNFGLDKEFMTKLEEQGWPSLEIEVYKKQGFECPGYSGAALLSENLKKYYGVIGGGIELHNKTWIYPKKYIDELIENGISMEEFVALYGDWSTMYEKVEGLYSLTEDKAFDSKFRIGMSRIGSKL